MCFYCAAFYGSLIRNLTTTELWNTLPDLGAKTIDPQYMLATLLSSLRQSWIRGYQKMGTNFLLKCLPAFKKLVEDVQRIQMKGIG